MFFFTIQFFYVFYEKKKKLQKSKKFYKFPEEVIKEFEYIYKHVIFNYIDIFKIKKNK